MEIDEIMKKLEEWLYNEINNLTKGDKLLFNNYLSWNLTKEIESNIF